MAKPSSCTRRRGRYLHDMLTNAFQSAGVQPRYVQQMSHAQAILSLVSTGLGIAIVPEHTRNACFETSFSVPSNWEGTCRPSCMRSGGPGTVTVRCRRFVTSCTASDQSFGLLGRHGAGVGISVASFRWVQERCGHGRSMASPDVAPEIFGGLSGQPGRPESANVFYGTCFSAAKRAAPGVRWVGAGQLTLEAHATAVP